MKILEILLENINDKYSKKEYAGLSKERIDEIEKYLQQANSQDDGSVVKYKNGKYVVSSVFEGEEKKSLTPTTIKVGDEVKVGKFKNRKAIVKGFAKDKNNQPVLKTNKGDQKLFKPRISKLMDKKENEDK